MRFADDYLTVEDAAARYGKHRDTLDRILRQEAEEARMEGREPRARKYKRPGYRQAWVKAGELDALFLPRPWKVKETHDQLGA